MLGMLCAGLGTIDSLAWVDIHLAAPLGTRSAIRAADGATLPRRTS